MNKVLFILFLICGIVYANTVYEKEPNNHWFDSGVKDITLNDVGVGSLYFNNWLNYDIDDWWKITPTQSGILTIYTTGATKNIDAELYDPKFVADDYSNNKNIDITVNVTKDKTYYLDLFYDDVYWSQGSYHYSTGSTDYELHFKFTPNPAKANDDIYTGLVNESVTGNVLDNDEGYNIAVTNHTNPSHGTLTINSDGSFTYIPANDWTGTDSFTYTITDESGNTDTATVSISIMVKASISTDERDFTLRKQFNIKGDYKMVGNGVLCYKYNNQCVDTYQSYDDIYNGVEVTKYTSYSSSTPYPAPNNDVTLSYINTLGTDTITVNDENVTVFNASQAEISDIPADAKIVWVGFYTQGDRTDETLSELETRLETNSSYLIAPNGDKYKITPTQIDILDGSPITFSTFAEVKGLEGKSGSYFNGWWTGVNIQTQNGYNSDLGYFGAWNMVVVYEENGLHLKNISIYDGYKEIYQECLNYNCTWVKNHDAIIDINGFLTPFHGTVNSKMSVFTGEGDAAYTGDQLLMKDTNATDYTNVNEGTDEENNAFDSSVSGFETNPDNKNKYGIDIHNYNVGTDGLNIIKNGDTNVSIKLTTNGDTYFPNVVVFATDLYEPRVCYYIDSIKESNGTTIYENGAFVKGAAIDPNKEYNVTIWISNMKKDANDTDIENAKDVKVFMTSNDFEYINNSTFMKNIGWNFYQHQTDANDSDLFTYLPDNNESDYHVGVGADGDQGGEIDVTTFDNVNGRAYINFLGKFIVENNTTTIDLNQTFKFKASFETDSIKITDNNAEPIEPCVDLSTIGNVYVPNPGSFNVVENSFSTDEDPTDVNDPLNQIYTKIINKPNILKVLSLDDDYKELKDYQGIVEVDLINNPEEEGQCESNPSLVSYFVTFDKNDSSGFSFIYNKALRDGRFRVKYLVDGNGNIIESTACTAKTLNCVWGLITQIATGSDENYNGNNCPTGTVAVTGNNGQSYCNVPCAEQCNYYQNRTQGGGDVPDEECLECLFDNYSSSVCSRDDFAVRPYKYKVMPISNQKLIAGQDINLTVQALDYNGNLINDFDFANAPVELNVTDAKGCKTGNFTPNAQTTVNFVNGEAEIAFNYSEIGDLNISVKEDKNGNEFAKVDENDSLSTGGYESDDDLLIGKGNSIISRFYPDHFTVLGTYSNYHNSSFTYISNDLNMSADLNLTIIARNINNITTQNYNEKCYAKNFDLNVSYNELNASNVPSTVIYELNSTKYNTVVNNELNFTNLSKNFFTTDHNGSAYLSIKINFEKNYTKPVNEFNMTVKDINVSDVNGTFGIKDIDQIATFRYGRIKVSDASAYSSDINTTFEYQYWTDTNGWVINTDHNSSIYGDFNHTLNRDINPNVYVGNSSTVKITDGKEKVEFHTDHALPYSTKVHLGINSWLWYYPLAKDYKDPSKTNTDCRTHPCLKLNFLKSGTGWGGVEAINNSEFSEKNRTSEMNSTGPDVNVSKSQVKKINW